MRKINTGDIVIGNLHNSYMITGRGVECLVLEVRRGHPKDIKVQVLDGRNEGYTTWVESKYFDYLRTVRIIELSKEFTTGALKPKEVRKPKYEVEFNKALGVTFVEVGDVTIALPIPKEHVSITVKHPDDVADKEIAQAVAYTRLAKKMNS